MLHYGQNPSGISKGAFQLPVLPVLCGGIPVLSQGNLQADWRDSYGSTDMQRGLLPAARNWRGELWSALECYKSQR